MISATGATLDKVDPSGGRFDDRLPGQTARLIRRVVKFLEGFHDVQLF